MNNAFQFSIILLAGIFCSMTNAFTQEKTKEVLQIRMVGDSLDKLHFDLDGNNLLINGKKPEEFGISIEIIRHKEGDTNTPQYQYVYDAEKNQHTANVASRSKGKPYLGITTREETEGLLVIELHAKSAAKGSGLRVGDVIQRVDGSSVRTHKALIEVVTAKVPGDPIAITYLRRNKSYDVRFRVDDESIKNNLRNSRGNRPTTDNKHLEKDQDEAYGNSDGPNYGLVLRESPSKKYLRVIDVKKDSRAENAGVKVNDYILSINGKKVPSVNDAANIINGLSEDVSIKLKIRRAGKEMNITL